MMEETQKRIKSESEETKDFPIVAIGTSVEGVHSLMRFLKNIPERSGIAFIIVQHLDPMNKSLEFERNKGIQMEVIMIQNKTKINPNCVYLVPANKDISIRGDVLSLTKPTIIHGLRMPIDTFLRSMAQGRRERSIAVILSGVGTDGTLGVRAIKETSGLVLVQQPDGTELDGMPSSAINSGMVDIIALPEELPQKIISFLEHAMLTNRTQKLDNEGTSGSMEKIVELLCAHTGQDFSFYKIGTVYRRVERRMHIHQIRKMVTYVEFLHRNPEEVQILFKELLIGVTSFFREPIVWDTLKQDVIPALLTQYPNGQGLRAWTPGCSTGEEAYSLAICFMEALAATDHKAAYSLQIFATDLDTDAIDKARKGMYPKNIVADVSPERLNRFFVKEESGYRICKKIREMVIFASHNITMDPPFTKLDLLTCRNLLIYFKPELQKRMISLFYRSLNINGILVLGSAETIGFFAELFYTLKSGLRIYQSVASDFRSKIPDYASVLFPVLPNPLDSHDKPKPVESLQSLTDQIIIREYSPATILVNDKGDILYITGKTGKYIEPAAGKANWNIFAMAREDLQCELAEALWRVLREKSTVVIKKVGLKIENGAIDIQITIQHIEKPVAIQGTALIVFKELDTVKTSKVPVTQTTTDHKTMEIEMELLQTRIELQISREEMQISGEELKSKNEELQSTNEELQAMIEELTTSKEEMQSLNEELHSVNGELLLKLEDLSQIESDMRNLLDSTEIATIFLDNNLHVRRYTTQAAEIFNFIPRDIGRPITDITSSMCYIHLPEDVRQVIETGKFVEKQTMTHNSRWYLVRIMPYRTMENIMQGVVITFSDITEAKKLEMELRKDKIS